MAKIGVLLINIGSPKNFDRKSVSKYLREFLSDKRIIALPTLLRTLLVNFFIVPFRSKNSAKQYQAIWLQNGSPLVIESEKLKTSLQHMLGENYQIEIAMRYGDLSITNALAKLKECAELIVIPLFPQYSSAATGSAIEEVLDKYRTQWNIPTLKIINQFYYDENYLTAYAKNILQYVNGNKIEVLLFSFHGLPEFHLQKSECRAQCDHIQPCPAIEVNNQYCYRAQCYATARMLAQMLNLKNFQYRVVFQSRLGRLPWIQPYLENTLQELAQQNIKNIAVVSPSFVTDCLETLEEINIRARKTWQSFGGEQFTFIPCLNTQEPWLQALRNLIIKGI